MIEHHNLAQVGWFSEQPDEFRNRILEIAQWTKYRPGELIYQVGDEPNGLFGLESGNWDISIPVSEVEMVTVHRGQSGFWIGDSAIFSDSPRGVTVTAHNECLVLVIPTRVLRRYLSDFPADLLYFYKLSHQNVMLTMRALAETIALPSQVRFARLLLRLTSKKGVISATQDELSALAGMSRATYRRALAGLSELGAIKTEYGSVVILDRPALERAAESI